MAGIALTMPAREVSVVGRARWGHLEQGEPEKNK